MTAASKTSDADSPRPPSATCAENSRQPRLRVDSWEIAHGRTVLGTCYPRQRRIRLSYLNVFLPPELRDYIIRHELAHLTEPGHTAAFHTLCDRYCSGRESQLTHSLRNYHWPVDR
ncbi:M48 metallopeptidase family protein [Duncaniella dubosii]|uniref:M48 metallopeptidase family protein n=1 Tax=Duncaniella dubosii TaxID=2518971 RepID=UPI00143CF549|nr:M48 family metallopeptidase [Duncaniella dubosii]